MMKQLNEELLEALYLDKFTLKEDIKQNEAILRQPSSACPHCNHESHQSLEEKVVYQKAALKMVECYIKLLLKPFLPLFFIFLSLSSSAQICEPKEKFWAFGSSGLFAKGQTGFGLNTTLFKRLLPGFYGGLTAEALYVEGKTISGQWNSQKGHVQAAFGGNLSFIPVETASSPMLTGVATYSSLERWNFHAGAGWAFDLVKFSVGWGWVHTKEQPKEQPERKTQLGGPMAQLTFIF